jgi:hypothetical protein
MRLFFIYIFFAVIQYIPETFIEAYKISRRWTVFEVFASDCCNIFERTILFEEKFQQALWVAVSQINYGFNWRIFNCTDYFFLSMVLDHCS